MKTYTLPDTGWKITQQEVDDLLCAALYGGIGYWAEIRDYKTDSSTEYLSDCLTRDGSLTLGDVEDGDSETWLLDLDKFLTGIAKLIEFRKYRSVAQLMDDHDSEDADLAVQFAVLGELVYG